MSLKEWITVSRIPDALVEILFRLMKTWKIYLTKTTFSENHGATLEGKWVYGGGIEIPCNYDLFGPKIYKNFVREKIKSVNIYHVTLL